MPSDRTIAAAFNALAHPRRVHLFRLLVDQPEIGQSVNQLEAATGFSRAVLLHHLRILEAAGVVARQRKGSSVSQILRPSPLLAAMREVDRQLTPKPVAQRDVA